MNKNIVFFGSITFSLKSHIEETFHSINFNSDAKIAVCFDTLDIPKEDFRSKILLLSEPPAVMPQIYRKSGLSKFDLVIVFSPWQSKALNISNWVYMPIAIPEQTQTSSVERIHGIVMINDHKFSSVKTSLYGYRRKLILRLQEKNAPIFLFGPNWKMNRWMEIRKRLAAIRVARKNIPLMKLSEGLSELFDSYSSYQGHSANKYKTLSDFRFALVIENDIGSLSEKLFDAIFSRCIVFYLGPGLDALESLNHCIIKLPHDIPSAITVIQENLENPPWQILDYVKKFTEDPNSMKFVSENVIAHSIVSQIGSHLKINT
jgi:hypothetical protein